MKICILLLLTLPLLASAAGSFRYVEELRPILEQRVDLLHLLEKNFQFEVSGSAARISQSVNPNLGGKRVGPYRIAARSKDLAEAACYEITVYTESAYFDDLGNPSDFKKGSRVVETFVSVEIKPVDRPEVGAAPRISK